MEIFIEKVKEKKRHVALLIVASCIPVLFFITTYLPSGEKLDQMTIEFYPTKSPITTGDRIGIQVILYNDHVPVEGATVKVQLQNENEFIRPIEQKLSYFGNGLYETELQLLYWGKWNVDVEVKQGREVRSENFQLQLLR